MARWLLKSEPDAYSIDDLAREGVGSWDGVRNFQARNNLRAMQVGDEAFFYHSSTEPPGIAGICEVVKEAYPDPSQFEPESTYYDPTSRPEKPKWYMPEVRFVRKLPRLVTLRELRETPGLEEMQALRRGRLSVSAVSDKEWEVILTLAEGT